MANIIYATQFHIPEDLAFTHIYSKIKLTKINAIITMNDLYHISESVLLPKEPKKKKKISL